MYFEDHRNEAGHGRRSVKGGAASLAARAINALVQIGSVLFLARHLTPEDYGLVGMVTAITGVAPGLVDLGTRDAIVQRARLKNGDVSALFWMTVAVGCGCGLIVMACSPLIASFYGEPRLTMITLISALTFVFSALGCQHYALMRRSMQFQELGAIEVAANIISAGAAIAMALGGFQYWALVVRPVALQAVLALGLWIRCRWLPTKPTLTTEVKDMVKFGLRLSGFTVTDFGARSSDRVAIGYRSGAKALGYYQNALFVYENLLDVLVAPLHGVAVASLSKVQNDLPELRRLWGKALSTVSFFAMPAFGILAVTSVDVIALLLGARWSSAGTLLSILALRGIPHCVERTAGWLHVAAGRTDRWMRYGVIALGAQLVALGAGLPFGPEGVVTAYVVCMFIMFIPAISYAGKPLHIGARDVISEVWRPLSGTLLSLFVTYSFRVTLFDGWSPIPRTTVSIVIFAVLYLVATVGLLRVTTPLEVIPVVVGGYLPKFISRLVPVRFLPDTRGYEHS